MKKIAAALFLFISMAVIALPASATPLPPLVPGYTIHFTGVGGASAGGEDIFPYIFNITNNSDSNPTTNTTTGVQMMCIDFSRQIVIPETWQATLVQVSGVVPVTATGDPSNQQLRALAILDSEVVAASAAAAANPSTYTGPSVADLQYAAWGVLTDLSGNANFYATAAAGYESTAMSLALTTDGGFAFSDYSYFDPEDKSEDPSTYGDPQRFMLYTGPGNFVPGFGPSPVPEPSSLMLLGTGVLGVAGVARRRFKK